MQRNSVWRRDPPDQHPALFFQGYEMSRHTMIEEPQPNPGVMQIEAYVPGSNEAAGGQKVFKLSSNETPLGPSAKAIVAFQKAAAHLELYPDGASTALRKAIAAKYGLDPERIVCGNGSDDLLHLIAAAYIGEGDEGIFTEHGFLVYRIAILSAGGKPVVVPERNFTADVDAILAAVTERTKIVFLANPNNPTGTYLGFEEVKRLHAGLPRGVLLVLDGAYAEYVRRNDYSSGIELVSANKNVVMTRTFSKIHGLAALRIGWVYGPETVCDMLNRVRGPFNLNAPAIACGVAAINDADHVERAAQHNEKWLAWLTENLTDLGLEVTPSAGNFILIHFPDVAGKLSSDADRYLSNNGVILRAVKSYGIHNALRMTVGTEEANRLTFQLLKDFMNA